MNCKKQYVAAVKKFGKKEVDLGIRIEKEHGGTVCDALKVTVDHLNEFPNYNSKLIKFERDLAKRKA
jgi:hypothetical protein